MNNIIVKKDENLYQVSKVRVLDSKFTMAYELQQIGAWDYIAVDENDDLGWVVCEYQLETVVVYNDESLLEKLKEEEFEILNNVPKIYDIE